MPHDIKIPAVGESITSGQISKWHFADGAAVKKGDLLITLETDKVAAEIMADATGQLKIIAVEGSDVAVGSVVGSIDESVVATAPSNAPAPVEAPKSEPSQAAPKPAAKAVETAPVAKVNPPASASSRSRTG